MHNERLFVSLFICCMMAVTAGCSDDSSNTDQKPSDLSCVSPNQQCGEACVNFSDLHWQSCGKCAAGYEDKDGNDANGCETQSSSVETNACKDTLCGTDCVKLDAMHWQACGTCADGWKDADGNASNGCETEKLFIECEAGQIICDESCVNLSELHWSDCGICSGGYEDADGDASNGCEKAQKTEECTDGSIQCSSRCIDLSQMHWKDCNVCLDGWEDSDGNAENGCESVVCAPSLTNCDGTCTDLTLRHWTSCNVCVSGYEDADGDPKNGCEKAILSTDGTCAEAANCANLLHVASSDCIDGKCKIVSCSDGYADCDGDAVTGCETSSASNYYSCGAKGLCRDEDSASINYKGTACKLGEQCLDSKCTPVPAIVGCSDGTREGFLDLIRFNNIAACSGAWSIPGIHHDEGPACDRKSGNTGSNHDGTGCNLEDLCADGWHVCLGRGDVATRSESGCDHILDGVDNKQPWLFITRTSSTGSLNCDPDTVGVPLNMNDIFGCGNFGCYATGNKCDPLKLSGHNMCSALTNTCGCTKNADGKVTCNASTSGSSCYGGSYGHSIDYFSALNDKEFKPAWDCSSSNFSHNPDGQHEAEDIIKHDADSQGGVMCCKNQCSTDADCGTGLICRYNVCVECIINKDKQSEGCPAGKTCNAEHKCQ